MVDNLKNAINRVRDVAEEYRKKADEWYAGGCSFAQAEGNECLECAKEQEQLAEWLTELQERRETMEHIKKYYILVEKSPRDNPNELIIRKAFGESEDK